MWLSIYNSPFVFPKIKFRFGKIRIGVPYFLPRYWSKKKNKWVQKKWFGIDVISLGWKTKFDDYRFEWRPGISIILFNRQFNITFIAPKDQDFLYWENWLYYHFETDKTLNTLERTKELSKMVNFKLTRFDKNGKQHLNYLSDCIKPKYQCLWKKSN